MKGVIEFGGIRILPIEQSLRIDLCLGGTPFLPILKADSCSLDAPA
jgi:hypothetical protein